MIRTNNRIAMETSNALTAPCNALNVLPQQPGEPVTAVMDRIREAVAVMPQVHGHVTHYFSDGLYARQVELKADTVMVGKIHLTGHINVLLSGTIDVMTELGVARYTGPAVILSPAGEQKVGNAITDCTWVTIHATNLTELDDLERELVTTDLTKRGVR